MFHWFFFTFKNILLAYLVVNSFNPGGQCNAALFSLEPIQPQREKVPSSLTVTNEAQQLKQSTFLKKCCLQ